jgi:hypothetical protein
MSTELVLSYEEINNFNKVFEGIKDWCSENQLATGVGEMAVGANLIAWGVHNGVIEMGTQLVATQIGGTNLESLVASLGGSGVGAVAAAVLGSIGIDGVGGVIGVPAALVIGGASAVFAMAGYTVGDIAHNIDNPPVDYGVLSANSSSMLLIGLSLIVDGARRCISDRSILAKLSIFTEDVIYLKAITAAIVAKTVDELNGFIDELKKLPENIIDAAATGGSAGTAGGAIAGSAVAASSVTVLDSSSLGGVAVSLGIVSAPLWPVIAGVAGEAGFGYAAYNAVKYWGSKPEKIFS